MLLLVIDTAGPTGGVLLAQCDPGATQAASSEREEEILGVLDLHPREFSAEMIPAIAELLGANQLRIADVDAFAVVSGPGSFTGLRVGLSAVKAMAEATGKPILILSRLAILASIAAQHAPAESASASVHLVLDAGRGEFYHGIYRDAGRTRISERFETLDALEASIRKEPGEVVFSEPAVKIALSSIAGTSLREIPLPNVRDALRLALASWNAREFHDPADVDANYLRRSDVVAVSRTKADPATQPAQHGHPRR